MIKKNFLAIFALSLVLAIAPTGCSTAAKTTKTEQTTKTENSKKSDSQKNDEQKNEDDSIKNEDTKQEEAESSNEEDKNKQETSVSKNTEDTSNSASSTNNNTQKNTNNTSGSASNSNVAQKANSSTSSSSNNSASSSSSSSSSGTAKPSTPSTPQHTHSYTIPITETVSVPEQGHYETKTVQEAQYAWRTFCGKCKADLTDLSSDDFTYHVGAICHSRYYTDYVKVKDPVTESVWVVDSAATTRTETVGWKCSCGATK